MKTARGIYYNLDDTEYIFHYDDYKFYFSSSKYLEKFKNNYIDYIKQETLKLNSKYKCIFVIDNVLLINLYKSIETRGFKVDYKNIGIDSNYSVETIIDITKSNIIPF